MATSNHTKFDTLRIKKKKTLVTQRQNGGEDSFLGTADKAPERHSVSMPMQEDSKLRSLQSTWLTAQPDPKKTKLLYPTLMRVMKDFPGQCSPEQLQNYIAKVLGDASVLTASSTENTWILKCTVKQFRMAATGRSHAYCQGGVLLEDSEEVESMQKLKTDLKDHNIPAMCKTDTVDFTLPVTESLKDMPVTDPQKTVLVLEVWTIKKEKEKEGNFKRMTSSSSLIEPGDKFAGRVFCSLRGIPLDGEERELTLFSHSKRHKRGEMLVHLSYKPSQVADVSSAMLNYGHLFKLLVFHESRDEQSEKEHVSMWSAKLSPQAKHLLLIQAISTGLSDLQCIAIELGALMDYHECYTVQWGAFLSLVERIESNLSATSSLGQPPGPNQTLNWPPELQHELMDLRRCIQEQLCAHLYVLGTRSDDQQEQLTVESKGRQKGKAIADLKGELINVLQTLQKLYMLKPFAELSNGTIEECIRTSIEEWFLKLHASSTLHTQKDCNSKASALKMQAEACMDTCQAVQKHIVAVFKEFGVSYYSIFIQVVGSKLSELCQFCISEEKSLPLDQATSVLYYQAYLVCRQIEKYASVANPSVLETLNIWKCYGPVVGSWVEAAWYICKERIKKAVDLDTVVRVTDGAHHSSSAVDVAVFLHQAVVFWKSLNWPDPEQAFGYALAHFQNICHCTEDYAKTIYKRLNAKDLAGQSFEMDKIEKVCIVFNNMAHLSNQLNTVSEKLDMDSLYSRLTRGQTDAKNSFDRLRESTKEDIEHRIQTFVEEYSKTLAPDIRMFITKIMETGHETDASLEALRDHLTQSLQAFGDYLLDEVFQIILARVWSTTLKCFQAALSDIQKGVKGQVQADILYQAVLALRSFFYVEGNGLTGENLENNRYKCLLAEIECKRLATSDLVFKCCTQLSQCQPQSSAIGELSVSVQYAEERSVLEVNVLTARLLNGTKKDGSADTIVQVWMMPQMALQDTKTRYKTDLKKGTLTPKYDKEFQIPAKTEDLKKDGTCLALAVYHTDAKHIAGLCLLPCQDIPVLRVQESCASKEWVLPLFLVQDTSSLPLRELLVRQAAHDPEATKLYKYLNKKLHVTFRSSPS
ncbi:hypothetical protein EMCRGX_G027667 [Ephydatia muelleri]